MAQTPQVLLITDDSQRRQQWMRTLHRTVEVRSPDLVSGNTDYEVPEVVITDALPLPDLAGSISALLARGEVGIVSVAARGPADVALSADYTGRELRLACRLLAEIVRLRRRRNQERRASRALKQLAYSDPLTGLANRRIWDSELATRLEDQRVPNMDRFLCVALFDLDHFKLVNDRLGHVLGDEVLRTIARRLTAGVRDQDLVARLGGDEFAVCLADVEHERIEDVVERIRQGLEHSIGDRQDGSIVTASTGFVLIGSGQRITSQEAMTAADRALCQAKTTGRNRSAISPLIGRTPRD